MEKYNELVEQKASLIAIPIQLGLDEIQQALNAELDETLYEDNSFSGDNMKIKAVKNDDIKLRIKDQTVFYTVPLDLDVVYRAGITNIGAKGAISLDFKTDFDIGYDWRITTRTEVEQYHWTNKPRINVAGVNVNVGFIGDLLLRNSQPYLARQIDHFVAEELNLDEIIRDTWEQMYEPLLVSSDYRTWVQVQPTYIGLTPLNTSNNRIETTIMVEADPRVVVGPKPTALMAPPLPELRWRSKEFEGFVINLSARISYEEAERLAREQSVGQTYTSGKYSATVQNIEIYGQGDKLVIGLDLTGSYNGSVYLEGVPVYNEKKDEIQIDQMKFTANTKSFLMKSAAWLLNSTIESRIQKTMNFYLDANLKESKEMLQKQLDSYKLAPGIQVSGKMNELRLNGIQIIQEGLQADLLVSGLVGISVYDLQN